MKVTIEKILSTNIPLKDRGLKIVPDLEIGDSIPQGDLNFTLFPSVPSSAVLIPSSEFLTENPSLQLAPGRTKGSRHCLSSLENVNIYKLLSPNVIQGQGLILEFTGETIITHPEHDDQLWKKGVVIVTHQRQRADELRAIAD